MPLDILRPLHHRQSDKAEFTSLALKSLIEYLEDEHHYGVLDLGPAVGANVDFFSKFSCQLYVADVLRTLESKHLDPTQEDVDWDGLFQTLLPYEDDSRFDLILAWDILNYLTKPQIEALMRRISRFCSSNSILFAMIITRREMPARPQTFQIVSSERLLYKTSGGSSIKPCPAYREPDLLRLMPPFKIKNTYLLRNGIQEYLFIY
jgi:hypothetical protein